MSVPYIGAADGAAAAKSRPEYSGAISYRVVYKRESETGLTEDNLNDLWFGPISLYCGAALPLGS